MDSMRTGTRHTLRLAAALNGGRREDPQALYRQEDFLEHHLCQIQKGDGLAVGTLVKHGRMEFNDSFIAETSD